METTNIKEFNLQVITLKQNGFVSSISYSKYDKNRIEKILFLAEEFEEAIILIPRKLICKKKKNIFVEKYYGNNLFLKFIDYLKQKNYRKQFSKIFRIT